LNSYDIGRVIAYSSRLNETQTADTSIECPSMQVPHCVYITQENGKAI